MKPGIWANMPVKSIKKTIRFYTALGMKPLGPTTDKLVCFKFTSDAFVINFFKKSTFKKSVENDVANAKKHSEIIFTIGADSEKEVNDWTKKVKEAKGKIHLKPTKIPGGYNMVFADPDGHRFNVFMMQATKPAKKKIRKTRVEFLTI